MKIILCVGNCGSGKSTWARQYIKSFRNVVRLNADCLRAVIGKNESDQEVNGEVFKVMRIMARYFILNDISLVIDNLNYNKKNRAEWIKIAQEFGVDIIAAVFRAPYEICVERNNNRERKVPLFVLEKVRDNWQEPTEEEGFAEVVDVNEELVYL